MLDARGDARGGRLADLPRRAVGQDRRRPARSRQARRRAARRRRCALGVRVHEHTPALELRGAGGGVQVATPDGAVHREARAARHERLPAAAALGPPLRRADLRLRAGQRAAQRGAARRDRLGAAPGPHRGGQPVPLLPPDGRPPDPVRRLRRGLPLPRPRRWPPRRARRELRQARAALLHDLPPARGPAIHPSLGRRDRHVQPLLGLLRHRARTAASRTSPATRASASVRRASAPASRWICSTAARARRRGRATCARSRCRSRPSRCAGRACS